MIGRLALLIGALMAGVAVAAAAAERRMLADDEALAYRAVGRLNIDGARFCSATLISDRLVLTAAHCLYRPLDREVVRPDALIFVAGQRRDDYAAVREVARLAVMPGFHFDPDADLGNVAEDIALLELAAPVEEGSAAPFPVGRLRDGAPLRIVSYSKDRAYVPSIAGPCPSYVSGDLVVLGCGVNWGASGAPVFAEIGGRTRLVAVVSAMTRRPGREGVALVLPAAPKMAALRAALEAATP
ncbi:trypsin-like serine protease [uncultured Amaricoccus sp.]|uniref:trypsin-like serine peptidase n=1 Tax=uncultured Amaricoccus sp. TaxID=339341 RepID=UPI00262C32DF|nr:trypsin-like serine protease [uncultured Amaricoccus sp.]